MPAAEKYGDSSSYYLTAEQANLLFAAFNSNNPADQPSVNQTISQSPDSFHSPPVDGMNGFPDAPLQEGDEYQFGDSSFDFGDITNGSEAQMIGDMPDAAGSTKSDPLDNESHDKRSYPDDEEEDEADNVGGAKRRESSDKVAKKPGRKPLTTEPTSKRKAQNRAAQRAFRERKEKHLKDLETKVDELQKASEQANDENGRLRAQMERMTNELNEYKTRFNLMNSSRTFSQSKPSAGYGSLVGGGNMNDVNFQFEFPKFGVLPGPPPPSKQSPQKSSSSSSVSPHTNAGAATTKSRSGSQPTPRSSNNRSSSDRANGNVDIKQEAASMMNFFDVAANHGSMSTSRASTDSVHYNSHNGTTTSSPSASSQSNAAGPSSSCGTSPESFTQSPMGFKPIETMTTIGEEQSSLAGNNNNNNTNIQDGSLFGGGDFSSFDWLAQQNGGQFDPQLFGDYREPQDNILSGANFDESFFNDALDTDFFMPYNMASPGIPKSTNILDQIDAQNADDAPQAEPPQAKYYGCNEVWNKLQNCPKVQTGEFDLDSLCSELQKKAKCSGQGPVIPDEDLHSVISKWSGKAGSDCASNGAKPQAVKQ